VSAASTSGKPLEVVIAGGGITGLATAFRLLERGGDRVRVTVCEADERLGGRSTPSGATASSSMAGPTPS
jgi:glycine/D-amino acid oxidase-like deaminating enzyme